MLGKTKRLKYLPALLFAIREVPQESLWFSSFELFYGRIVRGPMAILKELWSEEISDDQVLTAYQYVIDLREKLVQTNKLAHGQLRKVQGKQEAYYDRRARFRRYKVGDKVLLLLPTDTIFYFRMNYRIDANGIIGNYYA